MPDSQLGLAAKYQTSRARRNHGDSAPFRMRCCASKRMQWCSRAAMSKNDGIRHRRAISIQHTISVDFSRGNGRDDGL